MSQPPLGLRSAQRLLLTLALALLCGRAVQAEPLELSRQLVLATAPSTETDLLALSLPTLRTGSSGAAVSELSRVLERFGAPPFAEAERRQFGRAHEIAVRKLQGQFGLIPDGIAGPRLYTNLAANLSLRNAILEAWAMRLEHLAYEARSEGARHMLVINIPSSTLRAIDLESGKTVLETPVVAGRIDRQTPLGRINITGIRYNPTWSPPPVILRKDIVPRLGNDPAWLDKKGLVAISPEGDSKPASALSREEYAAGWRLHQPAGRNNALGRLKFETDSRENIYLHDTNDPRLFKGAGRLHSSGCVRVEQWTELAALLTHEAPAHILSQVETGHSSGRRIRPTPVYVEYSLGDVSAGKALVFPDVYQRAARSRQK